MPAVRKPALRDALAALIQAVFAELATQGVDPLIQQVSYPTGWRRRAQEIFAADRPRIWVAPPASGRSANWSASPRWLSSAS